MWFLAPLRGLVVECQSAEPARRRMLLCDLVFLSGLRAESGRERATGGAVHRRHRIPSINARVADFLAAVLFVSNVMPEPDPGSLQTPESVGRVNPHTNRR